MNRHPLPLAACLLALAALVIAGCNAGRINSPAASLNGNWSFVAPAAQGAQPLILNAGFQQSADGSISAVAHLNGAACVSATAPITLSGFVSGSNRVTLVSQPFGETKLTLRGDLAPGGKSILDASWTFAGGSCADLGSATVTATNYTQINGTYNGTFIDAGNNQIQVTATLTQTSQPDANGQYHLSGSATFPNNPCFTQSIVTDSLVTGNNLSTTYTQGSSSITAVGTFNSGATQLTVSHWQVSGGLCDGDTGTGLLTEQ